MPLTSPSYPRAACRFKNREFLSIPYRTDMEALRAVGHKHHLLDRAAILTSLQATSFLRKFISHVDGCAIL